MARHRRKLKVNKLILPAAVVVVLSVFVIAAALYPSLQGAKASAAEYFEVIDPTVNIGEPKNNGTVWIVTDIGFTLKAIKGPAHNIAVLNWAGASEKFANTWETDLQKGNSTYVEVVSGSSYGVALRKTSSGWGPVRVTVICDEAEGEISFYLPLG